MPDRIYAPIEITSSNNTFVITEQNAPADTWTVQIPAGTYATYYASSDLADTNAPASLYYAIRTAIAAAGGANYAFGAVDPSLSTLQTNAGLFMSTTGNQFSVDFDSGSFTMDPRWFGFATGEAAQTAAGSVGLYVLISKYTVYTQWVSYTITNGEATDKTSSIKRELAISSDRTQDAYQVEWNSDRIRRLYYEMVPAAHVYEGRQDAASAAAYYSTGELHANDYHNAFETIWNAASRLGDLIVQFDDVSDLDPGAGMYALARFEDASARESMSGCVKLGRVLGEYYSIDVSLNQSAGTYEF